MLTKRKPHIRNSLCAVASFAGIALGASLGPVHAATVQVTLSDHGAAADMPTGLGMGMPGADMTKASMSIMAMPATIESGPITFEVTNASKDLVHEMLVVPVGTDPAQLPYDASNEAVNEDTAGSLGEVEERDPGATGALTLDLKPGQYILFCNVPGHYTAGMWTTLTVEPKSILTQ
jgi:uncharacterized cupredoxin-like copper-binding protein